MRKKRDCATATASGAEYWTGFARVTANERESSRPMNLFCAVCAALLTWPNPTPAEPLKSQSSTPLQSNVELGSTPAEETKLDEILVTARRRSERLQDVPIAISVIDEKSLAEKTITNSNDLGQTAPGLSVTNSQDRTKTTISIRGQGEATAGSAHGVVAYFAEVPDFSTVFYDLTSVQVLKGPQGTLFGKNTTGGAVLLTPKRPTQEFDGYINLRAGNHSRKDVEFAVGGPIVSDRLSFRLAGQLLNSQGYTRNLLNGQHLDDEDRWSLRGSLLFQPTEGLENSTIVQFERIDENGTAMVLNDFADAPTTANVEELRTYLARQEQLGSSKVEHDTPEVLKRDKWGVINTTSWQMTEHFILKNIVSYSKTITDEYFHDADGSPLPNCSLTNIGDPKNPTTTEELQLQFDNQSGLSGVAGLYYEKVKEGYTVQDIGVNLLLPVPVPARFLTGTDRHDESKAAFVQASWEFLPDWSLTAGFRRTSDERRLHQGVNLSIAGSPPAVVTPLGAYDTDSEASTWNVALDYEFNQNLMTYLTIRRGYKAGGLNVVRDPALVGYGPEYVIGHEAGIKSQWDMGAVQLRANADVFYDDYKDIQRNTVVVVDSLPAIVVSNAAKATIRGADLDLMFVVSSYFDAAVQYTYLDAEYDDYFDINYGDLSESKFPNSPKHQVSFTPRFHLPVPASVGAITLQAPLYYQSEFAIDVSNTINGNPANDLIARQANKSGYTRLDLRLDWRNINDGPLSAAFYVRNVTDKTYEVGGFAGFLSTPFIGTSETIYGAPRLYSFELRYDFGDRR